ncbi:MAG: protein kinase [Anaerolineales bacterium]|nr:protein kinase [Anaerolineales bacterium]MCB8990334.1 protein kinase [Ardenticatenaceae bacterium]MCB9005227.1 protein kinase [Ardenticatenaceae bacterium]
MNDLIGKNLGKYRVDSLIGTGGMAQVYKGHHPRLKRDVAIKILHAALAKDPDFIRRFEREAAIVAKLRHPHVVQVYDFDNQDDLHYMVMEYIEGATLKDKLRQRRNVLPPQTVERFSLRRIVQIISGLADAIDYAHRHNIVHRDIKPANIMFTQAGEIVLADFGIVQMLSGSQQTKTSAVAGTPVYMSPEQGSGEEVDGRSDIYSLGVVLYELLTGQLPFVGDTPIKVILAHMSQPVPSLCNINPQLTVEIEAVVFKALMKKPGDRYQTARELAAALRRAALGEVTADGDGEHLTHILPPIAWADAPFQPPMPLGHFVGREREVAALRAQMADANGRHIFCLTGMGGIGKTALAIHLAHELRSEFPDGVLWANAATSEPLVILDSWARAFNWDFSSLPDVESRAAALRSALSSKRLLVVVDDVRGARQIRPLLPSGPHCTIIVTSREQDLPYALDAHELHLPVLSAGEGRDLLASIAGKERVMAEPEAAETICQLLGHLPLAVSIAGWRLVSRQRWQLADLAQRLRNEKRRLNELKINDREVRASFLVSWNLLTEREQWVFACMGVFGARPFRISALAAVADIEREEAEDHLYHLLGLSLVDEANTRHYQQHPLLADFAREQLEEDSAPQVRMAEYYRKYASIYQYNYEALEQDWDNIMYGMRIARERKLWQVVNEYAAVLSDVWFTRGRLADARQGYEWAVQAAQAQKDTLNEVRSLFLWGRACLQQSDYEAARICLNRSRGLFRQEADLAGEGDVLYELAEIAREQVNFAQAKQLLADCLQIRQDNLYDELGVSAVFYKLADIAYDERQFAEAENLARQALAIRQRHDDASGSLQVLRLLADIAITLENYDAAEQHGQKALALCHELGETRSLGLTLYSLSIISARTGDMALARQYADKGLSIFRMIGDRRSQAQALWHLSKIDGAQGAFAVALQEARTSLNLCEELGDVWGQVYLLAQVGNLYQQAGQLDEAEATWQASLQLAVECDHPLVEDLRGKLVG